MLHRADLEPQEIVTRGGLRITSVQRTLKDLAPVLPRFDLEVVLEHAWLQKLLPDPNTWRRELDDGLSRFDGRPKLMAALHECTLRRRPLESPLELRVWNAIRKARLPLPEVQVEVDDDTRRRMRPDFMWPQRGVIVEAIGFKVHGTRAAFEKDALRMMRLSALGFVVVPITSFMLDTDEGRTMEFLRRTLEVNRSRRLQPLEFSMQEAG